MKAPRLNRRDFFRNTVAFGVGAAAATAFSGNEAATEKANTDALSALPGFNPNENLISAPDDAKQWPAFRKMLAEWREATRKRLNYDDSLYRRADFSWVSSCFSCCFLMMCDETFYNPQLGRHTVESFLDHGVEEFGGYDAVVLWHAYPRIGIDERNQFDFYRDMPGGIGGLRELSRAFHKHFVKVFIDYNPWDTGTRREPVSDIDALVSLVAGIEADGIFLDTMHKGAAEFRAKLDAVRPGVALESELALPLENVHDHHMSWAQGFRDSSVPGVLRNKWFERRHMQHQIKRWDKDHTSELHSAWMNGSGMMVWENVFGTWVGWNARDRAILKAMLPLQRRFASLFSGEGWTPLVETEEPDVYASLWEGEGLRLWTLVNRSERTVEGILLAVPHIHDNRYVDLILQQEMRPLLRDGKALLPSSIPPRGIGAFIAGTDIAFGKWLLPLLPPQEPRKAGPNLDTTSPARSTTLKPVASTKKYGKDAIPQGMVKIPAASLDMKVVFRVRECGFYDSQVNEALWSPGLHKPVTFERKASLARYAIDLTPVTNAQFAEFLKSSGYKPKHPENFLKHWQHGSPPSGRENHPVVYVDLGDARAYSKWAGRRLPTEEEWQYAAQGPDALRYPWGNEMKEGFCNAGETGGTTSVTAFPDGRSSFGCYDMCGNVYEWTESERSDGRTRFCVIRGGSYYKAKGSDWYADGGPQPCNFTVKFLLMWPGLDRCATIGFRCVVDLADE